MFRCCGLGCATLFPAGMGIYGLIGTSQCIKSIVVCN